MKKFFAVLAVAAVAALAGCASQAESVAEPTPTIDVNAAACEDFADTSMTLSDALEGDATTDTWDAIRNEMDEVALTADGDVKTRLNTLVTDWPKLGDVMFLGGMEPFNELLHSVGRACEAAGHTVEYNYFVSG